MKRVRRWRDRRILPHYAFSLCTSCKGRVTFQESGTAVMTRNV